MGIPIDVAKAVQNPLVYILARSYSSPKEQSHFHEYRTSDLLSLNTNLLLSNGTPIHVRLQFFCGDSPAQQVQAGSEQGGYYTCVGCTTKSTTFDDIAGTYPSNHLTIADRQQFTLARKRGKLEELAN